jgi:hypothetical protein
MTPQSDTWSQASLRTPPAEMHDVMSDLIFDADGLSAIKRTQEIPAEFLDEIAAIRDIQDHDALGEFALAARIPTVVVEKWMREGFNIFDKNITVADIVQRLQRLDMDKLIATTKRLS